MVQALLPRETFTQLTAETLFYQVALFLPLHHLAVAAAVLPKTRLVTAVAQEAAAVVEIVQQRAALELVDKETPAVTEI